MSRLSDSCREQDRRRRRCPAKRPFRPASLTSDVRAERLESRLLLTTVNSLADNGKGTLRQAILDANQGSSPSDESIDFDLDALQLQQSSPGPLVFLLQTPLPAITHDGVTIDGYGTATTTASATPNTQVFGDDAHLRIELSGTAGVLPGQPQLTTGLVVNANDVTIEGLIIQSFAQAGNRGERQLASILGNFIGTFDSTQPATAANKVGVELLGATDAQVGTTNVADRNIIAGNTSGGVNVDADATGNAIAGNLIGIGVYSDGLNGSTFVPPQALASHQANGVEISNSPSNTVGGTTAAALNQIAGNGNGVLVNDTGSPIGTSSGTLIESNTIGTDGLDGFVIPGPGGNGLGNFGDGVQINLAPDVTVTGNTIVSNQQNGVNASNLSGFRVNGNFIGTDPTTIRNLGNTLNGIRLSNVQGATVGSQNAANQIQFNVSNGVSVGGASSANSISFNTIARNEGDGIELSGTASSNTITSNTVGNDSSQSGDLGNLGDGIAFIGSNATNSILQNQIAGNHASGVLISGLGSFQNRVLGNTIGGPNLAGPGGPNVLANQGDGITLLSAGLSNSLESNLIEGNDSYGIFLSDSDDTQIAGNSIGANPSDSVSQIEKNLGGNGGVGIGVFLSAGSQISANTISGNGSHGILITGGSIDNQVLANAIGVVYHNGQPVPLGNALSGIAVVQSLENTIGAAGLGNIIADNHENGIYILSSLSNPLGQPNAIQGNFIGTDGKSSTGLGNQGDGVLIVDSNVVEVGGVDPTFRNIISANQGAGVEIVGDSSNNRVLNNIIGSVSTPLLGNRLNGVVVTTAANTANYIGSEPDTTPGDNSGATLGNIIAANSGSGILVDLTAQPGNDGSSQTFIRGNLIGVKDANGAAGLGNTGDGIDLTSASNTVIQDGNLIERNLADGVRVESSERQPDRLIPWQT